MLVLDFKTDRPEPTDAAAALDLYVSAAGTVPRGSGKIFLVESFRAHCLWTEKPHRGAAGRPPGRCFFATFAEVESLTGAPYGMHIFEGSEGTVHVATNKVSRRFPEADDAEVRRPVLVDFWAEWCGRAKQIGPALEEIAAEMGDRVQVVKLNIDDNPMTPGGYGVRGIPTLMVFKDGKVASTKVGAMPKSKIVEWLNESV